MYTIIVSDSRGARIQDMLQEYNDIGHTRVECHPGAGMIQAVTRSLPAIRHGSPDLIIIMVGICDITFRDPHSKVTTIRYRTETEITQHTTIAARGAHELLRSETKATISFATITGLDLSDYNNRDRRRMTRQDYEDYCNNTKATDPDQGTLNAAIVATNRQLVALNTQNSTPTTWTAGAVHAYFNHAHHHYYRRLYDGCHAHTETTRDWAKRIAKTIRRQAAKQGPSTS